VNVNIPNVPDTAAKKLFSKHCHFKMGLTAKSLLISANFFTVCVMGIS
jgi:hypothetical protein